MRYRVNARGDTSHEDKPRTSLVAGLMGLCRLFGQSCPTHSLRQTPTAEKQGMLRAVT
jgi:hypothetical protein